MFIHTYTGNGDRKRRKEKAASNKKNYSCSAGLHIHTNELLAQFLLFRWCFFLCLPRINAKLITVFLQFSSFSKFATILSGCWLYWSSIVAWLNFISLLNLFSWFFCCSSRALSIRRSNLYNDDWRFVVAICLKIIAKWFFAKEFFSLCIDKLMCF